MATSADVLNGAWVFGDADGARLGRAMRLIWVIVACMAALFAWAYFARLDEVATGAGRVVPSTREQVIQSLEGGILAKLQVKQDDIVQPGQILAQLDPTQSASTFEESAAKYRAALASVARLEAEVGQTAPVFPGELDPYPELKAKELRLYQARRSSLDKSLAWLRRSIALLTNEVQIGQRLIAVGASSNVEVLRLQRQLADLELKQADLTSEYIVQAREELAKANAEVATLSPVVKGRADTLARLTLRSPVRGIVKNIEVSTIGGVIPPNGRLMDIVPLDDKLLVEARISPRDIAFIHPNQPASVKITAYDYAIYGGLKGQVATISPDTIKDEAKPDVEYYRVLIRTDRDALVNKEGRRFPIVPGMVATADIHTGSKTVFQYLVKPFNRGREALRER